MSAFRIVSAIVITTSVVVAVWVGTVQFKASERTALPLAPVRSGEFVAVIRARGQIQADRSVPVYAPLVQDLRIAWMAPASDRVEEGASLVRFDSSTAERDLIQRRATAERARANLDQAVADAKSAAEHDQHDLNDARLAVKLAELDTADNDLIQRRATAERARANLDQAVADAKSAAEHDQHDLNDARLAVKLAELDTADNDLVARLDAERRLVDLGVARQKLRQLEAEVTQREVSRDSKLASLRRQLEAADVWVRLVEGQIARMDIHAPISGFAIYTANRSSLAAQVSGGAAQPYRVGDQVPAGMNLATIPDLSSLLMDAAVEEIDRGRMHVGDEVIVRIDALPDVSIPAKLTTISPLAEISVDSRGREFHVYAALGSRSDERIRPGMNGTVEVVTKRIPGATIVPAKALFTRRGKPTIYTLSPDGFTPLEVEILARNTDEVAVKGVSASSQVAMVDPTLEGVKDSPVGTAGSK